MPPRSSASPGRGPGGEEGWWLLGRSCSITASPASLIHCFFSAMGGHATCLVKPSRCHLKPLTGLLGNVASGKVALKVASGESGFCSTSGEQKT